MQSDAAACHDEDTVVEVMSSPGRSWSRWAPILTLGSILGCTTPEGMSLIGPDEVRSPNLSRLEPPSDPAPPTGPPTLVRSPGPPGEVWLFAVGVSDYAEDRLDLHYADDDARAIVEFYSKSSGVVKPDHVTTIIDPVDPTEPKATRHHIMAELDRFLGRTGPNDLVIVYLAMHGFSNRGTLYVLPQDIRPYTDEGDPVDMPALRAMAISDIELQQMTDKSPARQFIIIADTCHEIALDENGRGLTRPRVDPMMARVLQTKPGVALLTASSANQSSREDERWRGGHGVFTASLLDGLEGAAETGEPGDGLITIRELFEYTRREVSMKTDHRQHPAISGSYDDSVPLAKVSSAAPPIPTTPRPDVTPPALSPDLRPAYVQALRSFDKHPCRSAAALRRVQVSAPEWGPVHHDRALALERCGRFDQAADAYLEYQRFAQPRELEQTRGRIVEMGVRQRKLGMALWIPSAITAAFSLVTASYLITTNDVPWLATGFTRRTMFTSLGIGFATIPGIAIGATYHSRGANLNKAMEQSRAPETSSRDEVSWRPSRRRRWSRIP